MRHLLNKQGLLNQMNTGVNEPVEYHKGGGGSSGPSAAERKASADAAALNTSRSNWDNISGRAGAVGFDQTGNRDNYAGYGAANSEITRREGIDSTANAELARLLGVESGLENKRSGIRNDNLVNNYYNHSNTGNSRDFANTLYGRSENYQIEGDYNTGKRVIGRSGIASAPAGSPEPSAPSTTPSRPNPFGGK